MADAVFRSAAGREQMAAHYDAWLAEVGHGWTSTVVDTRFGHTHLLVSGPEDGPPVMLVHGLNLHAVATVDLFGSLADTHRCYAVDVVGQPGRSAPTRPPKVDDSYGSWWSDLLDGLELDRAAFVGASFGGWCSLKAAKHLPERVSKVAVVAPAGVVARITPRLVLGFLAPLALYRLVPAGPLLEQMMAAMSSSGGRLPERWFEAVDLVMRHVRPDRQHWPMFSHGDFDDLEAPVYLAACGRDLFFPGEWLLERGSTLLPTLVQAELLPEAGHAPCGPGELEQLRAQIGAFLGDPAPPAARSAPDDPR